MLFPLPNLSQANIVAGNNFRNLFLPNIFRGIKKEYHWEKRVEGNYTTKKC